MMTATGATTTTTCAFFAILAMAALVAAEGVRGGDVRGGGSSPPPRRDEGIPTTRVRTPSIIDVATSRSSSSHRPRRRSRPRRRGEGRDDLVASSIGSSPIAAKDDYVRECASYLLSPTSIEDGLLSQYDLVDMLLGVCRLRGPCLDDGDDHVDLTFDALSVDLQLSFIEVVCPLDMRNKFDCVLDLYRTWLDYGIFGFVIPYDDDDEEEDDDRRSLDDVVRETCVATYPYAVEMGLLATSEGEWRETRPGRPLCLRFVVRITDA
jgi:hypothetical protein